MNINATLIGPGNLVWTLHLDYDEVRMAPAAKSDGRPPSTDR